MTRPDPSNTTARLARQVRFSVNPFLDSETAGANAYTAKPCGEGLALFLQLTIELLGPVQSDTGFVVNVTEIDRAARQYAIPVLAERIAASYRQGRHIDLPALAEMLTAAGDCLAGRFGAACVDRLILKLNPFREIAMETNEPGAVYFSEKFEFAAMHKLWNDDFSAEQNFAVFGKCANPTGHGHNYLVDVTVKRAVDESGFQIGRFEQVVDTELIEFVDHKNLNVDVPEFGARIPTVENLAAFAWERLVGQLAPAQLDSVTVWESDRTYCTYRA